MITIGDKPLTVADVKAVADGAKVELSTGARARIKRSRDVIEKRITDDIPTYGLNRGVGSGKDRVIPREEMQGFSYWLLQSHSGSFGTPLAPPIVRAAMLTRVAGMAAGGSGVSPAIPELLVAMLNAGVTPVVPSIASVGAADLGQMATIGLAAIGQGEAEVEGQLMSADKALAVAGLEPATLGPKDGLSLASANGVSVGHGALLIGRVAALADVADIVAALALEATGGSVDIVNPHVAEAKPFAGQSAASAHIADVLAGSYLETQPSHTVQDEISFRVIPQVHGALREMLAFAAAAVETELNAPGDNPLVTAHGDVIHNGNFEPLVMALAFDALRVAIIHTGQLSDRRMSHLWKALLSNPAKIKQPAFGIKLRYPAASRYSELRQLASVTSLDTPVLDRGVEDHATAAPLAVSQVGQAAEMLEDILVVEALMAFDLLAQTDPPLRLGSETGNLHYRISEALAAFAAPSKSADVHAAIKRALRPTG